MTLFFRATECGGNPVANLAADAFTVRENGNSVSIFESGQTLLSTSLGFERFSLLLLDMSGSTIASGALPSLLSAAEAFVDATVEDGGSHRVAIQLFDGRASPVAVIDYTNDVSDLQAAIEGLASYTVVDPSTNLNGAVIAALADVDARLAGSQAGAKASALVVFTDGTDQTGRNTTAEAVAAVNASPSAVFTVGLGAELDVGALQQIGKSGAEFAAQQSDIVAAFETIGAALEREAGGYYILSYCSPKRAGSHLLTVGVQGRPGQVSYTFNAEGFTQGCTPEGVSNPCAGRACGVVDGIVCGMCANDETCNVSGQCVEPGCSAGTHLENGSCVSDTRDCVVLNGTGKETWAGSAWGSCAIDSCNSGYHEESGACVSDTRDCVVLNGTGSESWNGSIWGVCTVTGCNSGYHEENGACVSDTRDCVVLNGTGTETWAGSAWGSCAIDSCNTSYHEENGACLLDTRDCVVLNGTGTETWSGSDWGACVVSVCNTGYHEESEACVSDTRDCAVLNGTGTETWNGSAWGTCTVVNCNAGYYKVVETCETFRFVTINRNTNQLVGIRHDFSLEPLVSLSIPESESPWVYACL
ncbi:MAG: VWA domain-containing protein, partial [Synechococcus sp.]|nr:VWA domain-containing protein [Synechococcus sp.]